MRSCFPPEPENLAANRFLPQKDGHLDQEYPLPCQSPGIIPVLVRKNQTGKYLIDTDLFGLQNEDDSKRD